MAEFRPRYEQMFWGLTAAFLVATTLSSGCASHECQTDEDCPTGRCVDNGGVLFGAGVCIDGPIAIDLGPAGDSGHDAGDAVSATDMPSDGGPPDSGPTDATPTDATPTDMRDCPSKLVPGCFDPFANDACTEYCERADAFCPGLFEDEASCREACGEIPQTGTPDALVGDTIQCRLNLLELSPSTRSGLSGEATDLCQFVGSDAAGFCVEASPKAGPMTLVVWAHVDTDPDGTRVSNVQFVVSDGRTQTATGTSSVSFGGYSDPDFVEILAIHPEYAPTYRYETIERSQTDTEASAPVRMIAP